MGGCAGLVRGRIGLPVAAGWQGAGEGVSEAAAVCAVALVVFGFEVVGVVAVGGDVVVVAEVPGLVGVDGFSAAAAGEGGSGGVLSGPDEGEELLPVGAEFPPLAGSASGGHGLMVWQVVAGGVVHRAGLSTVARAP